MSAATKPWSGFNYLTSVTVKLLQFERLSAALVDSASLCPLPFAHGQAAEATAWSKDDKLWLAVTAGSINGNNAHGRNRKNRHQQHRENRSTHVATIGALFQPQMFSTCHCHQSCWDRRLYFLLVQTSLLYDIQYSYRPLFGIGVVSKLSLAILDVEILNFWWWEHFTSKSSTSWQQRSALHQPGFPLKWCNQYSGLFQHLFHDLFY